MNQRRLRWFLVYLFIGAFMIYAYKSATNQVFIFEGKDTNTFLPNPNRPMLKEDKGDEQGSADGYLHLPPDIPYTSTTYDSSESAEKVAPRETTRARSSQKTPDDVRLPHFDGKLSIDQLKQLTGTSSILLLTYLRSGSSWLGEITRHAKNSFYVFEPFQGLIKQGYITNSSVCFYNNTCRQPKTYLERHEFIIANSIGIFSCDFHNIYLRRGKLVKLIQMQMQECLGKARTVSNSSFQTLGLKSALYKMCAQQRISDYCLHAVRRIIKTIRMSMQIVETLMELISNLKVIHLVRDPRAITNSRIHGGFWKGDTESQSRDLCNRMYNDVIHGGRLQQKYPDRYTLVMYEALADQPIEGSKFIFKYLNTTFDENVQKWVYETSGSSQGGFYSTQRNSTVASSHWRKELKWNKTRIIQTECQSVFKTLGYTEFLNIDDQRNFSLPSRKQTDIPGFT